MRSAVGIPVVQGGEDVNFISLVILVSFYGRYERAMLGAVDRITAGRGILAAFVVFLLVLPVALLMLPRLV